MKKIILFIPLIFLLVSFTMLPKIEEIIVFRSKKLAQNQSFHSEKVTITELNFQSIDGAKLHGISLLPKESKGVILYFHGNKGNVLEWQNWAEKMALQTHREVIMMDYRGYGKSVGNRNFEDMLNDVSLFYEHARQTYAAHEIVLFGRSLGGAFASYCASQFPCHFLVLESTFTSLNEVVNAKSKLFSLENQLTFPFESLSKVSTFQFPVYIIHGDADNLIPFQMGQQLYDAVPNNEKRFYKITGGGHNNLHERADYWGVIEQIF